MFHATLQQLRLFESVARLKSFTRAAEEVHLTQPAVSIQVKRLEENVGMPLFEHIGKQMHLTVAGRELYAACVDVLERLDNLETMLNNLQSEVAGPISISVVDSAKYFLPYQLGSFVRLYPKVEPRLQITNRERLLSRLNANEDDIYIMGQVPNELAVEVHPFRENVLVIVGPSGHPLAGERQISLERIAQEHFIGREPGSGTRKAVEEMFQQRGLKIAPYIELASTEAIKHGVMAGLGIAVLSLQGLRLELAAKELVVLDVEGFPLRRRWYAVHRKGKRLSLAAQTFLDYLQAEGAVEGA